MGPLQLYAADESGKMRSVHREFAEEVDINIPETRRIDSFHEVVQVLAASSISEACESRENNQLTWLWRQFIVGLGEEKGEEME